MEKEHKERLRVNRVALIDDLMVNEMFLSELVACNLISDYDIEKIKSIPIRYDKAGHILDVVKTRGPEAFEKFQEALRNTEQGYLADMLDRPSGQVFSTADPADPSYDRDSPDPEYKNDTEPRGRAIIINNEFFSVDNLTTRHGAQADVHALRKLLRFLNYHVEVINNLTANEIKEEIVRESQKEDHKKFDSFILFLLSHGTKHALYGTDGHLLSYTTVTDILNSTNCPSLRGKPKMIFIQICQEKTTDLGTLQPKLLSHATYPGVDVSDKQQPTLFPPDLPGSSDFFIVLGSSENVSWQHPGWGTKFIQSIVKVFGDLAHRLEFFSLVQRVRMQLEQTEGEHPTLYTISTLRRKFFFNISLRMHGEFNERLRRLCEKGKIPVYRQRVAIVGPYGVGKTHLAKRLMHEEYIKEEDANTTGVNIYRHRCVVHKAGRSCWIRGKDDPKDQFAQNMAIGVQNSDTFCQPDLTVLDQTLLAESLPDSEENINNMLTKRAAPPDDSESPASPDRVAAAPLDDRESPASPDKTAVAERDHLDDIDKELLEKIKNIARGEHVEPEKQVTIWDFAGQDVYYTTHQTFLSERIIYLLVFRLDQDLDDKVRVYRGEKTLKEFIMFWLNSIHLHTIGKLRKEDKNAMPYVLIIGTHKDMLGPQDDVEKIFDKLKMCLDDKQVLNDHVYQYFAVSNLAEDDGEFAEIKRTIEDLCGYSSNSIDTVQNLSVSWIKLEMNLAEKSEENPIITIEELREMAQRVGLPDEELQEKFIPYHHHQGDILHFKVDGLEHVVIIDPLWLAVVFSAIMTTASSQPRSGHFDLLKEDLKRGVLKEEVFDEYLRVKQIKMAEKKTEIIQLMLHFDLMLEISQSVENPLPGSGKRRFVVPSMLVSNNSANNALSETEPQKYLLIAFPHILFPTGLFHRLIVRLLRKYRAQAYEHNIPVVGFDQASFRMFDKRSVLHLAIEENAMRMMITNATGNKTKPHIYLNARKTVEEELSTLIETYCPRMQFEFRIRVNNKGKDIAIKAEDVQENEICRSVKGSEKAIDLTPYRIWFSDSAQAVQTSEPGANGPNMSFIHTQRFTRLLYLVIELGTQAIKTFFLKDVVRPGITDGGDISDNDAVIQFLCKYDVKGKLEKIRKKMYDYQWNLLYPASGHTDVETFDITLLVLLIKNLHPDKANLKWPEENATTSTPPQTTQGFIEHIQRLKNVRNFILHSAKFGIQDMEKFCKNWEIACASVLALGADPNEVEKVQKSIFSIQEIDTILCEIRSSAEDNKRHFDSRFDRLELLMIFSSVCAVLCAVLIAFAINYQWWI